MNLAFSMLQITSCQGLTSRSHIEEVDAITHCKPEKYLNNPTQLTWCLFLASSSLVDVTNFDTKKSFWKNHEWKNMVKWKEVFLKSFISRFDKTTLKDRAKGLFCCRHYRAWGSRRREGFSGGILEIGSIPASGSHHPTIARKEKINK